jgi:flagella basal body P-ring formation protein FlgA
MIVVRAARIARAVAGRIFAALVGLVCLGSAAFAVDLPVPRLTIYPGEMISDDMLINRAYNINLGRLAVYDGRQSLVGKVAKRTLLPGQPIMLNAVKDPDVVVQGKAYPVIFQTGGLTIVSVAMPLQNGGIGDLITLRNPDSGQLIKGIVQPDGTISVGDQ